MRDTNSLSATRAIKKCDDFFREIWRMAFIIIAFLLYNNLLLNLKNKTRIIIYREFIADHMTYSQSPS